MKEAPRGGKPELVALLLQRVAVRRPKTHQSFLATERVARPKPVVVLKQEQAEALPNQRFTTETSPEPKAVASAGGNKGRGKGGPPTVNDDSERGHTEPGNNPEKPLKDIVTSTYTVSKITWTSMLKLAQMRGVPVSAVLRGFIFDGLANEAKVNPEYRKYQEDFLRDMEETIREDIGRKLGYRGLPSDE